MDDWEIHLTDEVRDRIDALDDRSYLLVVPAIDIPPTAARPWVGL